MSTGGYTNSGFLQLTAAAGSEDAAFILSDLDAGVPVVSFTAAYKCLIGGGGYQGADGISFNFAPDLPAGTITEEGAGTGLTVEFDTFDNGAPDTAPAIDIKVAGTEMLTSIVPNGLRTGSDWVDVVVQLNPNNSLTVIYDGAYVYSNLDLTAFGYTNSPGSAFGFGARTGGLFDNQWIDNLSITTLTNAQPYVNSFAPIGRAVPTASSIDIVLTDDNTQVNANAITLKLDGSIVVPAVTTDGAGNTSLRYVKPGGFALLSTHTVTVTFADNATPTPHTNSWTYQFTTVPPNFIPGAYVTIFADGFENYVSGNSPLDMNYASGPNASANGNLAGNPWFGPLPPNARVVGSETGVTPHGGTNMITGSATFDLDQNWYNILYRLRNGQVIYGNCMLDWWFYDIFGAGDSGYRDNVALINYSTVPTGTDYPGTGNLNTGVTVYQRCTLGAANNLSAGYDATRYQCRNVGGTGYAGGWNNLSTSRNTGWHHARIIAGPPTNNVAMLYFYIDDMVVPAFSQLNASAQGFNAIEINSGQNATIGYFDDISFALAVPPNLSITRSGTTVTLSWPGGFTLQSAADVKGPYVDVAGATSPYAYDATTGPREFFRLRN